MDVRADLLRAIERARLELRARMGGMRKQKKLKKLGRPAKTGPGAGCGTGKGGFQSGNNCALEDGIPQKPFSKGGALKKANPKQLKAEVQAQKQKTAAKVAAKEAAQKKKGLADRKKNAAARKKAKEAKAAEEAKKASDAAAAKKKEMLQKIRIKKANEKLPVVGTPKSLADQLKEAKVSAASKSLTVAGTPPSIKDQIEEIKAAQAKQKAIEAAQKQAAEEAAAKQKAIAEARAKTAEKGKPAPVKKTDDTGEKILKEIENPPTTPPPQSLKTEKALGGSTGAVLATDATGAKFVVKGGKTKGHIENESQADDLYRAAGADVPKQQLHVDADGSSKKVAEFIPGKTLADLTATNTKQYEAAVAKLKKHFVADALFANHDVVGMNLDNIVVGKGGKVFRVDNGGSLTFRAQGKNKDFGPEVNELDTLRSASVNQASASVYGSLTNKEISSQITQLMKRKGAILAAAKTEKLRDVLKQRFDSLQAWQKKQKAESKAAKSKPLAKAPNAEELTANVPQGVPKVTGKGWTWEKRKALASKLWSSFTSGEQNAVTNWGGSSGWVKKVDSEHGGAAAKNGPDNYKNFVSALSKMPQFAGGVVYRGMKNITESQVASWISSGKFRHSFESTPQNTTHASMTTSKAKALVFSKGTEGRVLVKVSKPKLAKDTAGTIFAHPSEQEVIALPGAEYKIKKTYFIMQKTGGFLGYKAGAKIDEADWMTKISGHYNGNLKSDYSMHKDARLVRVIEVEEL